MDDKKDYRGFRAMREMNWDTLIWVIPIWLIIVVIASIHRGEPWVEFWK